MGEAVEQRYVPEHESPSPWTDSAAPIAKTVQVRESFLEDVLERLVVLTRKARKLGIEPPRIEAGEAYVSRNPRGVFVDITVTATPIQIAGWSPVATIDLSDKHPVFLKWPGSRHELPAHYFDAPDNNTCDHCQTKRNRHATIVLRNRESGHSVRVGTSCLEDFLGHPVDELWRTKRVYGDFFGEEAEPTWGRDMPDDSVELLKWLTVTAALMRQYSYLPRERARDAGRVCTTDAVMLHFFGGHKSERVEPTADDAKQAARIIEHGLAIDPTGAYEVSLRNIAHNDIVRPRQQGLATSMARHYELALERELAQQNSAYAGTVGERAPRLLQVIGRSRYESQYGTREVLRFQDAAGRSLVWFATGIRKELSQGNWYQVTGTVKAHKEHEGVCQTVLTRCAVKGPVDSPTLDAPQDEVDEGLSL